MGSVNKDIASNVPTKAYTSQSITGAALHPKLSLIHKTMLEASCSVKISLKKSIALNSVLASRLP